MGVKTKSMIKYLLLFVFVIILVQIPYTVTVYQAESGPIIQARVYAQESKEGLEKNEEDTLREGRVAIEKEFGEEHIMIEVARCESEFRQFDKLGKPLKSELGTDDLGIFQINVIHKEEMDRLGLKREKLDDNIKFARMLYNRNGLKDWKASKDCWSKSVTTDP